MDYKKRTYLSMLKEDISNVNSANELAEVLEIWRYEKFPCFREDGCHRRKYTCTKCYYKWLDSPVNTKE